MHMHLVTFQVIGRTPFDVEAYAEAHGVRERCARRVRSGPFATGPTALPAPEERGFKDTVKANSGTFTTIRAKFDLPAA